MKDLLLEIKNNQVVVSSRSVAENFGKRHDHVLRDIVNHIESLKSTAPLLGWFKEYLYTDNKGEQRKEYLMNRDGFSLLVMGFNNTRDVLEWKLKYIQAFNEMEAHIKNMDINKFIQSPEWGIQLLTALKDEQTKSKQLEIENIKMQPKVQFADAVSDSNTTILIGDLAKLLQQQGINIGQNRLFAWLRDNDYLIKRRGNSYNSPTQQSMVKKLFYLVEKVHERPNDTIYINKITKVTGKVQIYFINKFIDLNKKEMVHYYGQVKYN